MNKNKYKPCPADLSEIQLPKDIYELAEKIA